jgi:hypothetical protein
LKSQRTTAAIQGYLDDLGNLRGDSPAEPVIRDLPGPGLTQPPLNLQADEMLSGVVERLLKALNQIDRKMSGNSSPVPTRKRRLNRSLLLLTENSPVADFHG